MAPSAAPPPDGTMSTIGHHLLLELFGCDPAAIDSPEVVRAALHAATDALDTPVLGEAYHRFSPQGVTGVVLIAESHLSVHTWPEARYAAVDVYTCGAVHPRAALQPLVGALGSTTWLARDVVRGLVDHAPAVPETDEVALIDARSFHAPARGPSGAPHADGRGYVLRSLGIVDAAGLLDPEAARAVDAEVRRLVAVGQPAHDSVALQARYRSDDLRQAVAAIIHEPVADWIVPDQALRIEVDAESARPWRRDPGRCSLVRMVDVPEGGTQLQCAPRAEGPDDLVGRSIGTYRFDRGGAYLIRGDTLHRTRSAAPGARRVALIMAFGGTER